MLRSQAYKWWNGLCAKVARDVRSPRLWRRQFGPCLIAAATGCAASGMAASMVTVRTNQQAKQQFEVIAENNFMVLQNGLNEYANRLRALRALFDNVVGPVRRNEFEGFARHLLRENAALVTLSWVPRVTDAERASHEREGELQGITGYRIKATGADGNMSVSPQNDQYYPVFYATLPLTSPLYGFDLRSEPETLKALEQARDGDRLSFSPIDALVTTGRTQAGFIFSLPVYAHGATHESVEDRRRNLIGFVHGSLVTSRLIEDVITATKTPKGLDIYFFAPAAGPDAMPTVMHPSRLRKASPPIFSKAAATAGVAWRKDLTVDGQPWLTMVARPMPDGPLIADHERTWIVLFFGLILSGGVVAYLWSSGCDAVRIIEANERANVLAERDVLTSLANRRIFLERLGEAFAACHRGANPFAVLYFDLDHFKDVNDTLGHAAGDELLRQVAGRVTSAVRKNDVVARLGGDEFAILQTEVVDLAAAGAMASKIGGLLAKPYLIDGNKVHVTASIGISSYTPEHAAPDALLIQADLALYRAKEDGRNCFRFHSADLDRQVRERVVIGDQLRGASARNELELHYQPQVDLRTGRIIGLEALMRWNHPARGWIAPSIFIPVAERSGQILQLGQWLLDTACRQFRLWHDAGIAPEVLGLNFSALDFKGSTELHLTLAAALEKWRISPERLEIELTETVLMEVTQQHNERIERLRKLGVRIAIDDFGTGYSSLSYLTNYPINRMKIAQQLLFAVETDSRSAAVIRAAIRLAHELGIQLIAEGVETAGQEQFLLAAGCEQGQGYYFGKPVNAEQATVLLRKGSIKPARKLPRLANASAA